MVIAILFLIAVIFMLFGESAGYRKVKAECEELKAKKPLNERWGTILKWVSVVLGTYGIILFGMLQLKLTGAEGLYKEDVLAVEEMLTKCFFTCIALLATLIGGVKLHNYEKENMDQYRTVYFEKKLDMEYKLNWCIIEFVACLIGYVINLIDYAAFS